MSLLYLSDILKRAGLDIKRVKLIRHALNDPSFKACYDAGFVKEYTQCQSFNFARNFDYWIVFISNKGTSCKLYACYKVNGSIPAIPEICPKNFPLKEFFNRELAFFDLEHTDVLKELEGRLIIDWGKATLVWHHNATIDKPILAIQAEQKTVFTTFENVILTYDELCEIINNPSLYITWHTALSSIYAIYLITDRSNGKLYVGSAYGKDGLLGRWSHYVTTKHGGNKGIQEVICQYPERYKDFQFSILQILPKSTNPEKVIELEQLYKKKFLSIPFGMNEN